MNVSNGIEDLSKVLPSQPSTAATVAKDSSGLQTKSLDDDKAELSAVATELAQSPATSDVRLDKVASIQSALQSGTYQVPATDVAQKIITSLLAPEK
jgi:flagellar biosynthesis anti-sigma factor FlgM